MKADTKKEMITGNRKKKGARLKGKRIRGILTETRKGDKFAGIRKRGRLTGKDKG